MALRDKNGREVIEGDLLKVFHFVANNNRKVYMYKLVTTYGNLNLTNHDPSKLFKLVLVDVNEIFNPNPQRLESLDIGTALDGHISFKSMKKHLKPYLKIIKDY